MSEETKELTDFQHELLDDVDRSIATENARLKEEIDKLRGEKRDKLFAENVTEAVNSVGTFKGLSPTQVYGIVGLEAGVKLEVNADGTIAAAVNGQAVAFEELVSDFADGHRYLLDGRTLRSAAKKEEPILSKAELTTTAAKVAFIEQHGEAAFARLPLKAVSHATDPTTMTWQEWLSLPVSTKVKLVGEHGSALVTEIKMRTLKQKRGY